MIILQWIQGILTGIATFFGTIGQIFLQAIGLASPATGVRRFPTWLRWLVEAVFLLILLAVLVLLNRRFEQYVQGLPAAARKVFFPLLGLLAYAIFRLIVYIVRQLPSRGVRYADIDEALERGLLALHDANIGFNDVPVFLAVGMTKEAESNFAKLDMVAGEVTVNDDRYPVHWYGGRKGIWLTIGGISAISEQASRLPTSPASIGSRAPSQADLAPAATLVGGEAFRAAGAAPASTSDQGTLQGLPGGSESAAQFATMAGGAVSAPVMSTLGGGTPATGQRAESTTLLPARLTADEKDRCQSRVEYFARKLRELRYPVCPINSVAIFLPYEWITSAEHAMLSDSATADMRSLQDSIGVKCSCVAIISEIEKSEGLKEFLNRCDRKAWDGQRLGCGFPILSYLNPEELGGVHEWQLRSFEQLIYPLFQKRMGDPGNRKIVRFLDEFRRAKMGFSKVLGNAFPQDVVQPFYFGGVYFAAAAHSGKAAFLPGIIAKVMTDHEETIAWSPESMAQDRQYHWWTSVTMVAVVALTLLDAYLIVKVVNNWLD